MAFTLTPSPMPSRGRSAHNRDAAEIYEFLQMNPDAGPQRVAEAFPSRARAEGLVRALKAIGNMVTAIAHENDEFYVHVEFQDGIAPVEKPKAKPAAKKSEKGPKPVAA